MHLSEVEVQRLRKKLGAYIGKTNPEHIDIPILRDAIAEKITTSPPARGRWFQKAGLLHTLEEHARESTRRAAELRQSLAERTDWTPVSAETSSADGRYYLAQLVTEGHLKQESAFLEHCLGAGSLDYYLPRIRRGEIEIFSVRDARTHEPVVTIEYDVKSKSIKQVKGRNNQRLAPASPYVKQTVELLAFLKNHSVHHDKVDPHTGAPLRRELRAIADLEQLVRKNSLLLVTGKIVGIATIRTTPLMASDVLTGSFSIEDKTPTEIIAQVGALPVNVDARNSTPEQISRLQTVGGDLNLYGTSITSLPDNLTVGGYLNLANADITHLADNLSVGGDLHLRGADITMLPENLRVGGDLDLRGTKITSLPDDLSIGGSLNLGNTPITKLPKNLLVPGELDLRGTKITELPDNLTVGGNLNLSGTPITQLHDNLTVGGELYLFDTAIHELPPSIRSRIRGQVFFP